MKKYLSLVIIVGVLSVPMIFNSCQATHVESGMVSLSSNGACVSQIEAGAMPVYTYVRNSLQCATCHFLGSSAAPADYYFADPSPANAMNGFANLAKSNPSKFYDKVYDAGHYGGSGPNNQAALEPLKGAFIAGGEAFVTCISEQNTGGGNPGTGNLNPTKITIAKTIPANPTNPVNITWDLGTEMQTAGAALPGAQFRITIQATQTATGTRQYYISAPNARGATAGAIQIRNIRVYINGQLVALNAGGGTWTSLNNLAPRDRLHPLASGTGTMIIQADTTLATNTIAIGFGVLEVSSLYPDFNPTTYARLTSTANNVPIGERVFSNRCVSCHGATNPEGGMSLTANNLGALKATGRVVPFAPNASLIHARVSLQAGQNGAMPPTGPIPADEIRFIRDWILDGAP